MDNCSGCKCAARECLPNSKLNNKKVKSQDDSECDWWVNSPQYGNCFWTYVNSKSGPDGSMPELVQAEIAELMGWSNTKTHFTMKQAMVELIETLKVNNARDLLIQEHESLVDIPNIDSLVGSEDNE